MAYGDRSSGNSRPLQVWMAISFPVWALSQRGIFTVPMSSHWRWWVQPSATRTVSPAFNPSMAVTPRTASRRKPLWRAMRMEKDVNVISSGMTAATSPKTWLSVTTMRGGLPSSSSVFARAFSLTTTAVQLASRISRMVCCCGRMSRPFGAAVSIGTTRTTKSPAVSKSPIIGVSSPTGFRRAICSFNSKMPSLVTALTYISWSPAGGHASSRSFLLYTVI